MSSIADLPPNESVYRLRVERVDGVSVMLRPGGTGERDLVAAIAQEVLDRLDLSALDLGLWVTQARAEQQVREALLLTLPFAIDAALHKAKSDIYPSHPRPRP
jgi:hypothetical protein